MRTEKYESGNGVQSYCGGGEFPPLAFFSSYSGTPNNLIKLTQNWISGRKNKLICVNGRIMIWCAHYKMKLKKWLNQAPFNRFSTTKQKTIINLWETDQTKNVLIRSESKQVLGYSLVRNINKVWAWVVNWKGFIRFVCTSFQL